MDYFMILKASYIELYHKGIKGKIYLKHSEEGGSYFFLRKPKSSLPIKEDSYTMALRNTEGEIAVEFPCRELHLHPRSRHCHHDVTVLLAVLLPVHACVRCLAGVLLGAYAKPCCLLPLPTAISSSQPQPAA